MDRIEQRRMNMNDVNKENGITLTSIVVTVIILLILAGLTLVILNEFLTEEIMNVSNKTEEAFLKEKIEMTFMEVKTAYFENKDITNITKSEYFIKELEKSLEKSADIKEIVISGNVEESIRISLKYHNQKYEFEILANGEVNFINSLVGKVKIGDYIEYPVEYTDIYSRIQYTSTNGWRVIDDGVMEGTSGFVKIISTGIPVKWHYDITKYKSGQEAVDCLLNHFEDNILLEESTNGKEIKGDYFKVNQIANKVATLSLSDLNKACNALYNTNRKLDDISVIQDKYELFNLKYSQNFYYWLATVADDNKIYYLSDKNIQYEINFRMGIRPVIYLENNLNYKLENNVWKIVD